ncbi:hypothetical protein CBS101457_001315 [Exobasidium rhododendri]|nr:hypothetical protein CBS101457_001315 [Exobasidium rhododendri]
MARPSQIAARQDEASFMDLCVVNITNSRLATYLGATEDNNYATFDNCDQLNSMLAIADMHWKESNYTEATDAFYSVYAPEADVTERAAVVDYLHGYGDASNDTTRQKDTGDETGDYIANLIFGR